MEMPTQNLVCTHFCIRRMLVYWFYKTNILDAFDDAIHDEVDILSVSLVSESRDNINHFRDATSVRAVHAMCHGVLTVMAGGNSDPHIIVIGDSTIDRRFVIKVKLGDNKTFVIIILSFQEQ